MRFFFAIIPSHGLPWLYLCLAAAGRFGRVKCPAPAMPRRAPALPGGGRPIRGAYGAEIVSLTGSPQYVYFITKLIETLAMTAICWLSTGLASAAPTSVRNPCDVSPANKDWPFLS